ncbi:hypothetical protein Zm00014a_025598 [Zea mays]|uniref:RIN4 pathogenic type III effector avirulence factor Avr cleavage site domain-containing protein n=1 Tax=Zea mays TaxID=4577 RepID=A0A3L6FWA6_MAIZE|nr:hypothetical protein Zm00014a_025598 [Zea mays]
MAKRTEARPAAALPRASVSVPVPAFGGWEAAGGAAAADYSLDFTKIRAARMQRRKALSWSSFVGNSPAVVVATEAPDSGVGGGEEEEKRQWSSVAASDDDDDDDRERRRYRHRHSHRHRRLRSDDDDDRQPIQQPAPKGRSKFRGYLFGCVGGGLW